MISESIKTLLDRMDKFPEEFIDHRSDLTSEDLSNAIGHTRWEGITYTMLRQMNMETPKLFTPEEIEAYMAKIAPIYRKKLEEDICKALVRYEQDPRQGKLELTEVDEQFKSALLKFKAKPRYPHPSEVFKP